MLSVLRVHLPSEIPIVGCEITPYVLLRRPDGSITNEDVPQSAPMGGYYMRYRWYRVQSDQKVAVCSVHPTEQATLQCIGCVKAKLPDAKSYHCSPKCFSDAWQHHRALHDQASDASNENRTEEDELFGRFGSTGSGVSNAPISGSGPPPSIGQSRGPNNGSTVLNPASATEKGGGETLFGVGRGRTYTPTVDDIGHSLKFECASVDAETGKPVGSTNTHTTSRVIPGPSPSPRRMIQVNGIDALGRLDLDGRSASSGTFTVLSYNILSDANAASELYSYCPSWALSWVYRRQNLLGEIVGYHADILCLQEVQNDHFDEYFAPELDKHGYQAIYKKKTSEVYNGNPHSVDGCAIFFRRDRFALIKKYEVEFNKAAQTLTDALKKVALSRMIKDDIALIGVLEAKFANHGTDSNVKRLICVANTHLIAHQDHKDVKLWQVHTLLKGLEKIAASADIPMLVCGDFNSVPGSAPHSLMAVGKIDKVHPDLAVDPLRSLYSDKLSHKLPLVSAYSSFAVGGLSHSLEQQRRKMDLMTNEPLFTNCTRDFIGTLDYIFYTADSLTVESLLELLDEESLRKDTALPSAEWSSDHIALLAEFRLKPSNRR